MRKNPQYQAAVQRDVDPEMKSLHKRFEGDHMRTSRISSTRKSRLEAIEGDDESQGIDDTGHEQGRSSRSRTFGENRSGSIDEKNPRSRRERRHENKEMQDGQDGQDGMYM